MKTSTTTNSEMNSARVALLIGLSIGLGIAVHEAFFLIGGAIAVGALATTAIHAIHEHSEDTHLAYRPR
jgi:hypothetical protein